MGKRIDVIKKRLTRTNSSKPKYGAYLTNIFGFKSADNPFNNETSWQTLYDKEPLIRGAIDSKSNAIAGSWFLESIEEKLKIPDKKRLDSTKKWLSDPEMALHTKIVTIATKLQLMSACALEIDSVEKKFYILNKKDWNIRWNKRGTEIDHLEWQKDGEGEKIELEPHQFVLGSRFDTDTDLWMNSVMETMIDIANLLYHARKYNLGIFENGGVPSMLFTVDAVTTDKEMERFQQRIADTKPGGNLVARGIIGSQIIGGFNKDMEYEKIMQHAMQSIMTLLCISPRMMNIIGAGSGNDKQEADSFATSVHSYQYIINDMITLAIHKIFGNWVDTKLSYINSDNKPVEKDIKARPLSDPMRNQRFKLRKWTNPREQSALHKIYLDTQVMTPNEVRAQLGLEPRDGGDEVIDPGNRQASGNTGGDQPTRQGEDQDGDGGDKPSLVQNAEDK